ncbi:hypothetical protein ElyMa_006662600 [Elysia marginata]|uniref:Uncharacterized protein n=1 Tax=Elysia marginata TaxID=1093978 RepID=A0AAV4IKJ5_9GAST|nr:hypothetical protein ElyMa_006662600 [Elysia marginata]
MQADPMGLGAAAGGAKPGSDYVTDMYHMGQRPGMSQEVYPGYQNAGLKYPVHPAAGTPPQSGTMGMRRSPAQNQGPGWPHQAGFGRPDGASDYSTSAATQSQYNAMGPGNSAAVWPQQWPSSDGTSQQAAQQQQQQQHPHQQQQQQQQPEEFSDMFGMLGSQGTEFSDLMFNNFTE